MKNTKIKETRNALLILAVSIAILYAINLMFSGQDGGHIIFYTGLITYAVTLELIRIYREHKAEDRLSGSIGMFLILYFGLGAYSFLYSYIHLQPYGSETTPDSIQLAWVLKQQLYGGIGVLGVLSVFGVSSAWSGALTKRSSEWLYSFSKKTFAAYAGLLIFTILIRDYRYELATLYNTESVSAAAVLGYILLTVTLAATITSKKLRKIAQ
ncbi:hypothetical protein ACXU6U_22310 [Vibrio parahaemolyticus]|uniref:hypothetical protein n=1 Tax=Vibrio parahaemolyticus TaxID=670 RepID=UPI002F2D6B20